MQNTNPTVQSTKTRTDLDDDIGDNVLHLVYGNECRDDRRTYALCGERLHIGTEETERLKPHAEAHMCPLCLMERDAMRHGYPDDPRPIDVLALAEATERMLIDADITIPEAADRMGMDPDRLYHEINDGTIPVSDTYKLAEIAHSGTVDLMKNATHFRKAITNLRAEYLDTKSGDDHE